MAPAGTSDTPVVKVKKSFLIAWERWGMGYEERQLVKLVVLKMLFKEIRMFPRSVDESIFLQPISSRLEKTALNGSLLCLFLPLHLFAILWTIPYLSLAQQEWEGKKAQKAVIHTPLKQGYLLLLATAATKKSLNTYPFQIVAKEQKQQIHISSEMEE